jgi:hypothetical protein
MRLSRSGSVGWRGRAPATPKTCHKPGSETRSSRDTERLSLTGWPAEGGPTHGRTDPRKRVARIRTRLVSADLPVRARRVRAAPSD